MSTNTTRNARPAADLAPQTRPAAPAGEAEFDEIESMLRKEMQQSGGDPAKFSDPLMAELARIVGQQGPVTAAPAPRPAMPAAHDPFAQPPVVRPGLDTPSDDPLRAFEEELRRFDAQNRVVPAASPVAEAPASAQIALPPIDTIRPVPPAPEQAYVAPPQAYEPVVTAQGDRIGYAEPQPPQQAAHDVAPYPLQDDPAAVIAPDLAPQEEVAKPRNKKVLMMLGGAAAFAVVGVVGAVAFKSKPASPGGAPMIVAKTGPVKEKPADPGGVEISGQDRQVLARRTEEPKTPATVVTKEEQPVDLNQTPKREVSRVILPSGTQQGTPATPPGAIMMPQGSPQPSAAQPPTAGGFEAKRVRSVKISGDGEVVAPPGAAVSTPSMAAAPPPPPPAARAPEPPKSEARPNAAAKAQQQANATTTPQRTPPRQAAPAAAEPAGDNAPLSIRPPSGSTASTTPSVRRPAAAAPASGGSGGYAVQFAASPNQAEAQATANRVKQRHSDALGSYTPGVRQGQAGDRTVYRVRVSGLSREKANELCSSVKSEGGSCFVAGN